MTLQISLSAIETEKLSVLLKRHNEGLTYKEQLTYQELAEKILIDAIWQRYSEGR